MRILLAHSIALSTTVYGFTPSVKFRNVSPRKSLTKTYGYLDDLSKYTAPVEEEQQPDTSLEATNMKQENVDRFGPGQWQEYVEFDEFDGGDGQMGVAGDGNKALEKLETTAQMAKSKFMSAKNSWGTSTGYADTLREKGVDTSRAQQLENWHNQQEVLKRRQQAKYMTDAFDQVGYTEDENWRMLKKFGVERNQEFDLNEEFGAVTVGESVTDTFELQSGVGKLAYVEFQVKNEYMGFADFRAAFTQGTSGAWSVEPAEGSLSKTPVNFIVRFAPTALGVEEAYLVLETEDMKNTYKFIGST